MKLLPTTLSERLSYANVAATLALVVAIGGSGGAAYAVSKNSVRSTHIVNGQVKTKDLAKRAVKSPKIAPNAVNGSKIANGSIGTADLGAVDGVATAGVTVQGNGALRASFNRLGGAVSVNKYGVGRYSVKLPGHTPSWEENMAAVTPTQKGLSCSWDLDAPGAVDVICWNSDTGNEADTQFSLLVY